MGASRLFSATTDRIDCGASSAYNETFDSGATFLAWANLANIPAVTTSLVNKEFTNGNGWSTAFQIGTGYFTFYHDFTTNFMLTRLTAAYTNQWVCYGLTYNNSSTANRPTFYVNGVSAAVTHSVTPSGSAEPDTSASLQIGNRMSHNTGMDGNIAYVQIWKRILSVAEINEAMIRPGSIRTNLVGYWPCLGADSPERDLSGNGNSGTVTGTAESFNGPPVRLY